MVGQVPNPALRKKVDLICQIFLVLWHENLLQQNLSKPKPKAKSQAKASSSQRPSDPTSRKLSKANKSEPALQQLEPTTKSSSLSSRLRKEKESAAQPAADGMLLADGRAARAFKNLKEKAAEWTGAVANVAIDDEPAPPDSQARATFRNSCLKRSADLKSLGRQCRDYGKRMDKSSNKDTFEYRNSTSFGFLG